MTVNSSSAPSGSGDVRSELKGDANDLAENAKGRAEREAQSRKEQASGVAKSTSSALRSAPQELENDEQAPTWLSSGFRQAADKLSDMADTLQGKSVGDITQQTNRFARENPGTFLAGSAAAGFGLARILRAGAEHKGQTESPAADVGSTGGSSYRESATSPVSTTTSRSGGVL
ncbi:hypothetical protein [Croceicoccus marinus]|uniref:DUF3618 domain-containing protein n=1 Tax=Croceicoccus marinus TaxID=450378 RepID=A0A7G6VZP4_9SPHN|nr:hypothetical protein [Croceicoccus marinus]QNE07209.1 hypothetical protein H4O24_14910 [Croceicoccus marinus]